MIKSRVTKQSVSPDKYQINSNLVVHLADPVKKAEVSRKIQTQYKTAQGAQGAKASFFPSTATATTGASSGTGSQDPRRTSDAGSRQIGGTIDYNRTNAAQMMPKAAVTADRSGVAVRSLLCSATTNRVSASALTM